MILKLKNSLASILDLTPELPYFVIGIKAGGYRILNDHGRPYLFEAELFDVIDAAEPLDWISDTGEEGERYAYPAALNEPGFFENYFDGDAVAISEFWHVVNRRLSSAA